MITIETKLFSYAELSENAKKRVLAEKAESISQDPEDFTLSESMDSVKAIAAALGVRLRDWSVGPYSRNNYIRVDDDMAGNKALARVLRVLMAHGYTRPKQFKAMQFPGVCGFTGICFDDDVAETIWKELLDGETIGRAFDAVASKIARMCEDDLEYRTSKEGILDYLDQAEEIYTEEGVIF